MGLARASRLPAARHQPPSAQLHCRSLLAASSLPRQRWAAVHASAAAGHQASLLLVLSATRQPASVHTTVSSNMYHGPQLILPSDS
jgi:hypothetical protein